MPIPTIVFIDPAGRKRCPVCGRQIQYANGRFYAHDNASHTAVCPGPAPKKK